jgi:curli biogenesis system outer membrane secretion channel CsgG
MKHILTASFITLSLVGCATSETSNVLESVKVASAASNYTGVKTPVSVGKFNNRSSYMRGIFSDETDKLGNQSKTILESHLQQTGYFSVLNRTNLDELKQEAAFSGKTQAVKAARYVVTGDVTEFGRKEVGDQQLFGILGRGKTQVAYAKVSLNVVNTQTSEIVESVQGAGEFKLGEREVLGFGSTASYDSTLNGKVLDLAIREAVNNLVSSVQAGKWTPAK